MVRYPLEPLRVAKESDRSARGEAVLQAGQDRDERERAVEEAAGARREAEARLAFVVDEERRRASAGTATVADLARSEGYRRRVAGEIDVRASAEGRAREALAQALATEQRARDAYAEARGGERAVLEHRDRFRRDDRARLEKREEEAALEGWRGVPPGKGEPR